MNSDLCIITWVYGKKYQGWIPIFVYSIKKNYPEYDIKIFLDQRLSIGIKNMLSKFGLLDSVDIIENTIEVREYTYLTDMEKRCCRWLVTGDSRLDKYEYIYVGDIDIYIVKEKNTLKEQHIDHLKQVQGIYSNALRLTISDYIKNKNYRNKSHLLRLTGLHFFKNKEYQIAVGKNQKRILDYLFRKKRIHLIDHIFFEDDERCLWLLVTLSRIKYKTLSYELSEEVFRPLHGVHFALGRESETYKTILSKNIAKATSHYNYFKKFIEEYNSDEMLRKLIINSPYYIYSMIEETCGIWKGIIDQNEIQLIK